LRRWRMEFGEANWKMAGGKNGKESGQRGLLDWAIEREEWELAGLCLLLGMLKALERMPREAVDAMIDELAGLEAEQAAEEAAHRRRRVRGRRRGRRA
jgi:hypothetical protein